MKANGSPKVSQPMNGSDPIELKRGSVTVKIYHAERMRNDVTYHEYTLAYYEDGKRKRETFADLEAAKTRGNEVLGNINTGHRESVGLKATERDEYLRAKDALFVSGVSVEVAARHFAEAVKILGGDLVIEAARYYHRRNMQKITPKLVPDVVEDFLATRKQQNRSGRHLETLSSHCKQFASRFKTEIGSVTAEELESWLDDLGVGARTRDNYLASIKNLFEFGKNKNYVPREWDEIQRVTRLGNDEDGPIEIYTVKELQKLLEHADEVLIPFLAIGAFAGLRSSEIQRLDWHDVRFKSNCIVVQKGKVKKRGRSRRMSPLLANLKAWLKPHAKESGKVWPHSTPYLYELLNKVATKAGVALKGNALRHSFVSYRVASIQNVAQVAYESGNSPQIIDSNYRELVTTREAKQWFEIRPAKKRTANQKIVALPVSAAA